MRNSDPHMSTQLCQNRLISRIQRYHSGSPNCLYALLVTLETAKTKSGRKLSLPQIPQNQKLRPTHFQYKSAKIKNTCHTMTSLRHSKAPSEKLIILQSIRSNSGLKTGNSGKNQYKSEMSTHPSQPTLLQKSIKICDPRNHSGVP